MVNGNVLHIYLRNVERVLNVCKNIVVMKRFYGMIK